MNIVMIITFAILIEAVVQLVKPLWGDASVGKLTVTEIVSMAFGILVAVLARLNIAETLGITSPALLYVLYVFTGMAMGRGASFIHDLWMKISTSVGDTYK
ncbi:MAG: hypothetical protein GX417_07200 [Clostridiales bacterium]|nr:hypothetical protein [Clostridiales bacterium]